MSNEEKEISQKINDNNNIIVEKPKFQITLKMK